LAVEASSCRRADSKRFRTATPNHCRRRWTSGDRSTFSWFQRNGTFLGGRGHTGNAGRTAQGTRSPPVHGSTQIDATRLSRDVDLIASSVVQHLAGLLDAMVKITIEIEAEIPSGTPENVVRTVTENCRTLKFENQGFEEA